MKLKNFLRVLIYSITMICTILYIGYRIAFTVPTGLGILTLIVALFILFIEIWEAFDFFVYFFNTLLASKKSPKVPDIKNIKEFPDIDVLIATYNESSELLTKTITACKNMKYPDKNKVHIYLCDDGNRPEMKELAKNLEINYLTRTSNKNSKAGNYNHALPHLHSPYIATFDADMCPTENFLMVTVPYFLNSEHKMGFVQLPQSFKNPDIYQYRFNLENQIPFEQEYFYHNLQIAKNSINAPVYCGTNTLISREALNATNGFATGTISEDIATGMLIQSKGYKCLAINNIEAYGTSVNDYEGFVKQRSRWARGCVQMLKKYKILKIKGLSLRQKLEYLTCVSYWFFGFRRLVYLITPLLFSILGIIIIDCDFKTFLLMWLPQYILKRLVLDKLEGNKRSSTWTKIYETILAPSLGTSVVKEYLGAQNTKFEVTPKQELKGGMSKTNAKCLRWHLVLLTLNIIGFILCAFRFDPEFYYNYILSFVWTISNTFYLTIAVIFDLKTSVRECNGFIPNKIKKYSKKSLILLFLNRGKKSWKKEI
ncbi:MAG: glycosyltransferase [Clostridia bacterium]|nr:glycosyltransferase [Clostridia bacterium]